MNVDRRLTALEEIIKPSASTWWERATGKEQIERWLAARALGLYVGPKGDFIDGEERRRLAYEKSEEAGAWIDYIEKEKARAIATLSGEAE